MSDCMRCGGDVSEIWIITQILIEIIECKKRRLLYDLYDEPAELCCGGSC